MNTPSREKYFEEMDIDQKIAKMALAIDCLSKRIVDQGKTIGMLMQHQHSAAGLLVPMNQNTPEEPWYISHLLNRAPQ